MSGIRGKDTKPEMLLRKGLHRLGFRFRLHDRNLPGKPDLVFPKYRAVIFAHGCFWHGHDCHLFKWPSSNVDFWKEKIGRNVAHDAKAMEALLSAGWRVATVWECALKGKTRIGEGEAVQKLSRWLISEEETVIIRGG